MNKTRLSLCYLFSYLILAGLALLAAPELALKLLFATGNYGDVLPRLTGMILLVLGIFVLQAVRYRLEVLYTTALAVRGIIMLPVLVGLYLYSRDPLFISLLVVVGLGVVLTGVSYWLDQREDAQENPRRMS
jgi:uncharacterized protein YjeT (DUF2065 family)